jgi:hypothetical protein
LPVEAEELTKMIFPPTLLFFKPGNAALTAVTREKKLISKWFRHADIGTSLPMSPKGSSTAALRTNPSIAPYFFSTPVIAAEKPGSSVLFFQSGKGQIKIKYGLTYHIAQSRGFPMGDRAIPEF